MRTLALCARTFFVGVSLAAACVLPSALRAQEKVRGAPVRVEIEGGSVVMRATWKPLCDTVYGFEKRYPWIAELRPAATQRRYEAAQMRAMLPGRALELGDVWKLDARELMPFLRQLHEGATPEMHHGAGFPGIAAPGAWACLRAVSSTHVEILLRVHADFLLEGDGGAASSWMTPAQFEGRLWIDRQQARVAGFVLALPDRSANVDLNVKQKRGFSADIGRIPCMELRSLGELPQGGFDREITLDEARGKLRAKFYPLARIAWHSLEDAWKRVQATKKPLHVVALFGSLDDESC